MPRAPTVCVRTRWTKMVGECKWAIFTVVESKLLFASINCKALNVNGLCAVSRQPLSLDVSPFGFEIVLFFFGSL